jgi:hypothetical protein
MYVFGSVMFLAQYSPLLIVCITYCLDVCQELTTLATTTWSNLYTLASLGTHTANTVDTF